ncbi:MAG: D-alanyl-D-alanine carboxypeptidase family protein, partial [bacterium]|nr:D-alanyl-D-alanine carboxypeptidase family protein [bacterium]
MKTFRIFPLVLIFCLVLAFAAPGACALDAPELNGKAALIIDLDSGEVLYELNKDQQRAPASLTKIMTMLVALEALDRGQFALEDIVTAQADCLTGLAEDSSNAGITPGTQLSVKDLLYCTMIHSANEACNVLATYVSGSISAFVDQMNQKAAELGCVNTHFMNPNGLPAENHYSSAYDLYLMATAAMQYPLFMEIANTQSYQSDNPAVNNGAIMNNSNALISPNSYYAKAGSYLYEGASGIKTGYTNAAGYCLISTAQRDGINVMAIAMGCLGELNGDTENFWNFKDSITMYDWVFDNFSHRNILSATENITTVTVDLSDEGSVMLHPQKGITVLLPDDVAAEDIQRSITVYEDKLVAPIAAGTPLGRLTLSLDGKELGSVELVNGNEVALSKLEYMKQRISQVLSNGWVIALIVLVLVFLFVYLALVLRYRRLRQQHLRQRRRMEQR